MKNLIPIAGRLRSVLKKSGMIPIFLLSFLASYQSRGQSCCLTTNLNITTGYDPATNSVLSAGGADPQWKIVGASPWVTSFFGLTPGMSAVSIGGSWIAPANPSWFTDPPSTVQWMDLQRCFYLCKDADITFNFNVSGDDWISVLNVDGSALGGTAAPGPGSSGTAVNIVQTRHLGAGWHCINARINNYNWAAVQTFWFSINGSITSNPTLAIMKEGTGCTTASLYCIMPEITGPNNTCVGSCKPLNIAVPGGTWSSSNISVATIGASSGTYCGVAAGNATMTYTDPCGRTKTYPITVNPNPSITPPPSLCQGLSTTLTASIGGGVWTSANSGIVSVGASSGIATTGAAGNTIITYTLPTSCYATAPMTVWANPVMPPIAGNNSICAGEFAGYMDGYAYGTWSLTNGTGSATLSSTTAMPTLVTGVTPGTVTLSYTGTNAHCSATVTKVITIKPAPAPITGPSDVCVGSWINLSGPAAGGVWTSTTPAVATVVSWFPQVTGVSPGTTTIVCTDPSTGCYSSKVVNVLPTPSMTSIPTLCLGTTFAVSATIPGGIWNTSDATVATVAATSGSTADVTAVALGTAFVKYNLPTGCSVVKPVTVMDLPAPAGPNVCVGAVVTWSVDPLWVGGTWTCDDLTIALTDAFGNITGQAPGTANITYTSASGCIGTGVITVYPNPDPIVGSSVCVGSTATLSDPTPGGTWYSSDPPTADVDETSGIVTGNMVGSVTIVYTLPTGCYTYATIDVLPNPVVTGDLDICIGESTTLTPSITPGTWTSGSSSIATVDPIDNSIHGVGAGTTTISYTESTGGCSTGVIIVVNPLPVVTPIPAICVGNTVTAAAAPVGGTWSTAPGGNASITSGGIITGIAGGTAEVTYTASTGCTNTAIVVVNPLPSFAPHTNPTTVCETAPWILVWDVAPAALPGYTYAWSGPLGFTSPNANPPMPAATLGMSGVYALTVTNGFGCSKTNNLNVVINPRPTPTIVCPTSKCVDEIFTVTGTIGAGAGATTSWLFSPDITVISTTATTATIMSSTPGTAVVIFRVMSAAGCGAVANCHITINPKPEPITGDLLICGRQQWGSTVLSDVTPGGTWSSSNTAVAVIDAGGVVTPTWGTPTPATTTISYTLSTGCYTTAVVTVDQTPMPMITECPKKTLCVGDIITINGFPGYSGTYTTSWTASGSGSVHITPVLPTPSTSAIIEATGAGVVTITFEVTSAAGCKGYAYCTFKIAPTPEIHGDLLLCQKDVTTLTTTIPGGVWTNGNPAVAVITWEDPLDNSIEVIGGAAGTATLTYTAGICPAYVTVTVGATPTPMFQQCAGTVCQGVTYPIFVYPDPAYAGWTYSWSWAPMPPTVIDLSSTTATTAMVTAIGPGVGTISYTVIDPVSGCPGTAICTVTVNPIPAPIVGPTTVCVGNTITLTDVTPGATWMSFDAGIATVDGSGVVTGVSPGTTMIDYVFPTGCQASVIVTVNASPVPSFIHCGESICEGYTTTITADPGYTGSCTTSFTSSATGITISTLSSTMAVVYGVAGSVTITYHVTTALGCEREVYCTFDILESPGPISGDPTVCEGYTTTLTDPSSGGTWSSSSTSIATVDATTGEVAGVAAGTVTITYTNSNGCYVTHDMEVLATPHPVLVKCGEPGDEGVGLGDGKWVVPMPAYGAGYTTSWSSSPMGIVDFPTTPGAPGMQWMTGIGVGTTTITYAVTDLTTMCTGYAYCIQEVWPLKPIRPATGTAIIENSRTELTIAPNPNNGTFKLSGHLQELTDLKEVTIEIEDMLGKTLLTENVPVKNGNIEENIAMREVANGVYMVKIKGNRVNQVLRFVVDK